MASPPLRQGSSDRAPRTPPAPVPPSSSRSYVRKYVVLVDWWLERVDGKICIAGLTETPQTRAGVSSSLGKRKAAARVFRCAVATRWDSNTIETVNGHMVCECFLAGFPIKWKEIASNSQLPPKSADNAPSASVEFYLKKFTSDSFANSKGYFNSLKRFTSNTDGPTTQKFSNSSNGNAGNSENSMSKAVASEELGDGIMDMPEVPLPGEIGSNSQDYQHESLQVDACEQEIIDRNVSIASCSTVGGNKPPASKTASVEKEGHISRVGCHQEEQDAEVQHENTRSCSGAQEMVTYAVDSHMSLASSDLRELVTPKCSKTSMNLGTGNASEVACEGMTLQFGAVSALEKNEVRKLRSGRVLGELSDAQLKSGNKQKRTHHKASNNKKVPNEWV
ncbi:hypothetical protein EJB05_37189 [Eragrostis curvula]|uniref:SANTA domain-containing protein n=1 Tax=Eragrostis curvula TaxID=38414 RepID=A0A5J9TQV6_9POAL|nr:hypothetical protein EJB05_37189 [Eragrostis curvula]